MKEMFCFQCQQTAHNSGCDGKAGVCGKKAGNANSQDALTSALIGLARAVRKKERKKEATRDSDDLMRKGLFTTITNVNFREETVRDLTGRVRAEKE